MQLSDDVHEEKKNTYEDSLWGSQESEVLILTMQVRRMNFLLKYLGILVALTVMQRRKQLCT